MRNFHCVAKCGGRAKRLGYQPVTTTTRTTAAIYFFPPASRSEISFRSLSPSLGHMWNCELTSHSREEFRRRRSSVRPSVSPSVLMANEVVINLGKWTPPQKSPKERETEERGRKEEWNGWRTFHIFCCSLPSDSESPIVRNLFAPPRPQSLCSICIRHVARSTTTDPILFPVVNSRRLGHFGI